MLDQIRCDLTQIDLEFFISLYIVKSSGIIQYQKIMDDLKASEYAGLDDHLEPVQNLIVKKVATEG